MDTQKHQPPKGKPEREDHGKNHKEGQDSKKEEQDRKLDEQLEESFPASDPPGYVESEEDKKPSD